MASIIHTMGDPSPLGIGPETLDFRNPPDQVESSLITTQLLRNGC